MVEINNSIKQVILFFLKELDKNGIKPEKVYLFGSFGKQNQNKYSDIDIAIISPDLTDDRFNERIRLMKIAGNIDSRLEPVPFNSNTFIQEDPLVWEILKTGTSVFGDILK